MAAVAVVALVRLLAGPIGGWGDATSVDKGASATSSIAPTRSVLPSPEAVATSTLSLAADLSAAADPPRGIQLPDGKTTADAMAEASRLEKLGRWAEARELYRLIVGSGLASTAADKPTAELAAGMAAGTSTPGAVPAVGDRHDPAGNETDYPGVSDPIPDSMIGPEIVAAAVALARLELAADDPDSALGALQPVVDIGGLDILPAPGMYLYGVSLEDTGQPGKAAVAYEAYGEAEPAMADIADMAVGMTHFVAGRYAEAAEAFERASENAGDEATSFLSTLRLGNALLRTGPAAAAIGTYEEAYSLAGDDTQRAQALSGVIAAQEDAGTTSEAMGTRRRLVRDLPGTDLAVSALARLENAGESVSLAEESAVRTGAGDHSQAAALLAAAIGQAEAPVAGVPDPVHAPGALYLALAESHFAMGDHDGVIDVADEFVAVRPSDSAAPDLAWLRFRSLQRLNRDTIAADAGLAFADAWPMDARSPTALLTRGLLLTHVGTSQDAEAAFRDTALRYPRTDEGLESRFRAGLTAWMSHRVPQAAEHWTVLAESGDASPTDKARARFWLGRMSSDLGNPTLAADNWRQAAALDPSGFYGLRAAERLGIERPTAPRPPTTSVRATPAGNGYPEGDETSGAYPGATPVSGRVLQSTAKTFSASDNIGHWLTGWRADATMETWSAVQKSLVDSRDVARARAWLELGRERSGYQQLRATNARLWDDPVRQSALALVAHDLGLHRIASSAADNALAAAPASSRSSAPAELERLAYPSAFGDLVLQEAENNGIAPELLFALIRQESRFDPTAVSVAGASGLTQVMPATGRQIASRLGDVSFETADLFLPATAIRYGAWYLGSQLSSFDGLELPALAAYNGGPGSSRRWLDSSGGDMDLFAELIDFKETRRYVRLVTEQRAHYESLYSSEWSAKSP